MLLHWSHSQRRKMCVWVCTYNCLISQQWIHVLTGISSRNVTWSSLGFFPKTQGRNLYIIRRNINVVLLCWMVQTKKQTNLYLTLNIRSKKRGNNEACIYLLSSSIFAMGSPSRKVLSFIIILVIGFSTVTKLTENEKLHGEDFNGNFLRGLAYQVVIWFRIT